MCLRGDLHLTNVALQVVSPNSTKGYHKRKSKAKQNCQEALRQTAVWGTISSVGHSEMWDVSCGWGPGQVRTVVAVRLRRQDTLC